MAANEDLLFGKLALARQFCSQAQIDECLALQASTEPPPPLGRLLLDQGYITPEQHQAVLEAQKQNLDLVDPVLRKRKEAVLFGKLAVREGLLTDDEANECLRLQGREGETRSLGEVMLDEGYLTSTQVKNLLGKQFKKIMSCPVCRLSFTILMLSDDKKIDCPRCRGPLQEGKPTDSVRTDAEFSTQILRAVQASVPPPPPAAPSATPPPPVKKVKVQCVICDTPFEGALDATGRLRCPSCQTTFKPK